MKYIYIIIMVSCIGLLSCKKENDVTVPDFEVEAEKNTYKVGEDVQFFFSGNAEQLSFFSGEPLHDYAFREGRISETLELLTSFASNVTFNNQPNMLSVWLSTDYNGGGTYADIQQATWTNNVSEAFSIAPEDNPWGAGNNHPSGSVNLIEAIDDDKPLYLAFKYHNQPSTGVARNWYVYQFNLRANTLFGSDPLISSLLGFNIIYDDTFVNDSDKTSLISASGSYLMFSTPVPLRPTELEIWAVSPAIHLSETDMGPDKPEAIKGYRDPMIAGYNHVYNEPGEYTATFVAYDTTAYGEEQVVKEVKITITE